MPAWSRVERTALADLLAARGPDAPTLCGTWSTADLAAHLVVRDRMPMAIVAAALPPLAGVTERLRLRERDGSSYAEAVERVRQGAPVWSPVGFPPTEAMANTVEFAVHHEDVRRAVPGWAPRALPAAEQDALWRALRGVARPLTRRAPCGVVLRRPSGETMTAKGGSPAVTVTGEPLELLLFAFGRQAHARVDVTGDPALARALVSAALGH